MKTFPTILRSTSPTPVGRKLGFLWRGNSPLPIYILGDVVLFWNSILLIQICFMKSAMALRISNVQLPNTSDAIIFLYLSASNPDGPNLPLILIASFALKNWVFSSSRRIPLVMLLVNNFNFPLMFLFPINFAKVSKMFFGSLFHVNIW